MLLYYITDRKGFAGTESEQRTALLRRIADAARAGVDYIQLREKDLARKELELLAREALHVIRDELRRHQAADQQHIRTSPRNRRRRGPSSSRFSARRRVFATTGYADSRSRAADRRLSS